MGQGDHRGRGAVGELLLLAMPTIAQMLSYVVMQFTDTLMVSRLGTLAPTAAGNAGMFSFSVISFGTGVLLCVNTLVSQSFGQRDFPGCGRHLWQGVWFAVGFSALALMVLPLAGRIFSAIGHEPALVRLETTYFQITLSLAGMRLLATGCGQFLLAIDRPRLVMFAAFTGMAGNILANWILIFGNLGVRPMGLAGAAWGTNIAVTVELAMLVAFIARRRFRREFGIEQWRINLPDLRTLLRIGIPSGVQVVADVLAWTLFLIWVMAPFGTHAMAANNFMFRYMHLSFMPAFGMSVAVTALVGRYIGRGRPDIAAARAHLGFALTAAYMVSCGALFFIARQPLIRLFTDEPRVIELGALLLMFAAMYQLMDAMYIIYLGALRGAGDTFWPAVVTAGLCWGITVMGGYAAVRWRPQWGVSGPWIAATIYGGVLGIWMMIRFRRGRWKLIHLESAAKPPPAPELVIEQLTG